MHSSRTLRTIAPRKNFDVPYAEFLKIHYKGVTTHARQRGRWLRTRREPVRNRHAELADIRPGLQRRRTIRSGWLSATMWRRLALAYEPKNMIDLNWKIQLLSAIDRAKYAAQINKLIDKLYSMKLPKAGGRTRSTRKPSPRISSPITRCSPWPRPAAVRRPMSTWRAPSKRCWPPSGRKAVGKAIPSIRASTRRSAPRSLRSWLCLRSIRERPRPRTGMRLIPRRPPSSPQNDLPLLLAQLDQYLGPCSGAGAASDSSGAGKERSAAGARSRGPRTRPHG